MFLALALLLVAQLGAQLHSYAHGGTGFLDAPRQSLVASHGSCAECLAFAPLLSATGTPATLTAVLTQERFAAPPPPALSLPRSVLILAFRSRAPPPAQTA